MSCLIPIGCKLRIDHLEQLLFFEHDKARTKTIVVNAIVTNPSNDTLRLGFLHRKRVHPRPLETTPLLSDRKKGLSCFLFSRLFRDRVRLRRDKRIIEFRTFDPGSSSFTGDRILASIPRPDKSMTIDVEFPIADKTSDWNEILPENIPFTYFTVGPFAPLETMLIQFYLEIAGGVFDALIPEIPQTGTRFYNINGPRMVLAEISVVDLPPFEHKFPEKGRVARSKFEDLITRRIVANSYCICAVDSPNCNPHSYRAIIMNSLTTDLTSEIDPSVFESEITARLKERVRFFANVAASEEFSLTLAGPISNLSCSFESDQKHAHV